ncbi:hypothetical protein BO78DRAFT_423278 [Aspergillus sclerotiicarbonarius CBS 121057]|uniref:Uncharacterized protein n=1 Tax=Aspergillus sclerotiicarbonarius (strain CBS 121057 / IBT 28362) TaxID=1448318 RepID=A0A319DVE1_ASPSB|nr:hypothetical protein BO78DRAFT_423278 [Aspergillus sclerotiicarbonarius CBS 121057]
MDDDFPDVIQWQVTTTWFYFPCFRGYRSQVERLESAIDDADSSNYAIYQYCPFLSPYSWGVLIFVHHPVESDMPTTLAIARDELVRLREIARYNEEMESWTSYERSRRPMSPSGLGKA